MGGYRWFRRKCWLVPSALFLSLPTSARGVMRGRKARGRPLPSHHPQLPPCVTREVEQFFFLKRKYNIFVFQKFFLHYSNGLFIENVSVIKHWNRNELFVPCHQQNKGESDYGVVKKWLLHCSPLTNDDYCDEVKWDESPFGKKE